MKWKNLLEYRCPVCRSDLFSTPIATSHQCESCDFEITEQRFKEMVRKVTQQKAKLRYLSKDKLIMSAR